MDKLMGMLGGSPNIKPRYDDDVVDRLHRNFTVCLLVVFAVVVSSKQYVGDPINCWVPAHFTGNHEDYTNTYCWVKNTYYLPFDENIPKDYEHELRRMIPYYQWVPIILLLQALMFYIPCLFWRTLNSRSGINVDSIVTAGVTYLKIDIKAIEEKSLDFVTNQLDRYLREIPNQPRSNFTISLKSLTRIFDSCFGKRHGNYLITIYLMTKLLYLGNLIVQLFLLERFLGSDFLSYGIDVLWSMYESTEWTGSARFPRVTMCDFLIRRVGNIQRYTVQCALTINLFNERIYLFIWYWFVLLILITIINLFMWFVRVTFKRDQMSYIKKHLKYKFATKNKNSDIDDSTEKCFNTEIDDEKLKNFTHYYLGYDGIFVLKLVGENTNTFTVTEIVSILYEKFDKEPHTKRPDKE
ncbi:hypothetical protein A3Q56_02040 [Intoshia linei]|uniref:Innexin n=1 Tax=Intoshia linei TaxID=1819745 RepID=A0A177B9A7_9BILA|nr:hypothetical protein A3Q56_02040 [Intoshia linei]